MRLRRSTFSLPQDSFEGVAIDGTHPQEVGRVSAMVIGAGGGSQRVLGGPLLEKPAMAVADAGEPCFQPVQATVDQSLPLFAREHRRGMGENGQSARLVEDTDRLFERYLRCRSTRQFEAEVEFLTFFLPLVFRHYESSMLLGESDRPVTIWLSTAGHQRAKKRQHARSQSWFTFEPGHSSKRIVAACSSKFRICMHLWSCSDSIPWSVVQHHPKR